MIGYARKLASYFDGSKPKTAQTIPASLFFRKTETMGIAGLPFDLFISEKHALTFKVGEHPLQNGATVTDHVQRELQEVTVEGMFTNHPLGGKSSTDKVKFDRDYATQDIQSTVANTALQKLEALRDLAKKKEPVRLVCSLDIYPKMVITGLEYERDKDSGNAIRFSVTLREVNIVSLKASVSDYVWKPDDMSTVNNRIAASKAKAGKRSAEELAVSQMKELMDIETLE